MATLVLLALSLASGGAKSQTPQPAPLGAVGVFALLGDSVQVAAAQAPTDTRLDNTQRETLAFKGIGFDHIALKAVSEHIRKAQPDAKLHLYQAPGGLSLQEQRAIAAGAENAELPGWMVRTIQDNKLTHLLIITRTRGLLDARTAENEGLGRSQVEGIGFYLDRLFTMRNDTTGALSNGLIAPYLQIKLTLMDARTGDIVGRHDIRRAYAHAASTSQPQGDPWTYMTAEEKVKALRGMVEAGIAGGAAELVKPR
jgi:hypothetical protein